MSSTSFDHVIFDLGNVIFDWDPKEVANAISAPDTWVVANSPHWQAFDRGALDREDLIKIFKPEFPKIEQFLNSAKDYLRLNSETLEIFFKCQKKGYSLFILSNMPNYYRNYLISTYPFLSEVQGSIFSCDVGFIKPENQIYECLISQFSLDVSRCLFLDDREENIKSAHLMGMQGIVFDNPKNCLHQLISMQVL